MSWKWTGWPDPDGCKAFRWGMVKEYNTILNRQMMKDDTIGQSKWNCFELKFINGKWVNFWVLNYNEVFNF